jgi:hypothetical protein
MFRAYATCNIYGIVPVMVILFSLAINECQAQNLNSTYYKNAKGLCDGILIDLGDLISKRTPTIDQIEFSENTFSLPSKCVANLNDKLLLQIVAYKRQDSANAQSIINNYCAHMRGWVEYHPGTCQAGGPPPICPVNHWYQSPYQATQDFYNERNKIFNERLRNLNGIKKSLMLEACNCWLNDLKGHSIGKTNYKTKVFQSDKNQSYQSTEIKLPCVNGNCPTGFTCVNGYCVEKSIESNIEDNTLLKKEYQPIIADKLVDMATDKVLDYVAQKFKQIALLKTFYNAATENPYSQVVTGVFENTQMGTYTHIYQNELVKAQTSAAKLESLYEEQRRYKNNQNMTTDNIEERKTEMAKYRSELARDIFNIAEAADGIMREKELGSCSCYNVLNYQTSIVTSSIRNLVDKKIVW